MAIQSVAFNGESKHKSPIKDVLGIGLKGGFGAAIGYAAGRYVLPVSSEVAEKVMMYGLADTFIQNQPQPRRKPKVNKEDVKKETKVATPKAKTDLYIKFKEMVLNQSKIAKEKIKQTVEEQQLDKMLKSFKKYSNEFFKVNEGKEACIQNVRKMLRTGAGVTLAVGVGAIFTFGAIVDHAIKSVQQRQR